MPLDYVKCSKLPNGMNKRGRSQNGTAALLTPQTIADVDKLSSAAYVRKE